MRTFIAALALFVMAGVAIVNEQHQAVEAQTDEAPIQVAEAGNSVESVFVPLPNRIDPTAYIDPDLQARIDALDDRVETTETRLASIETVIADIQNQIATPEGCDCPNCTCGPDCQCEGGDCNCENCSETAVMPDLSHLLPNPGEQGADAQPTPYDVVFKAVRLLDLDNTERLVDFGCGSDARVLTHAFHHTGCRGTGIEIDPERADSARSIVEASGLSSWIDIVEGDATTTPVEGTVGFAYLWPETLEELVPQIQELDRFVSYAHEVPGLDMERIDVPGHEPLWYWEREPEVAVTYTERPYAIYNGRRYYSDYNRGCNCSMCRTIRSQLASRQNVEQIPIQQQSSVPPTTNTSYAAPRVTTSSSSGCSSCGSGCANGNCGAPRRFNRRR